MRCFEVAHVDLVLFLAHCRFQIGSHCTQLTVFLGILVRLDAAQIEAVQVHPELLLEYLTQLRCNQVIHLGQLALQLQHGQTMLGRCVGNNLLDTAHHSIAHQIGKGRNFEIHQPMQANERPVIGDVHPQ